ncbi:MAG: response regulator [Spirochaetaceae bacterium]|nr:response regulator [Spirochaetaceae bacterium]
MELFSLFVVDDENEVRKGIVENVDWNRLGFTVVGEASNGDEAVQKAGALLPDVILSDIRMPGMDGVALMRYIHENLPRTKVVVLSGRKDFAYLEAAIRNEVFAYLLKPANKELFEETFSRLHEKLEEQRNGQRKLQRLEELVKESPAYIREKLNSQERYKSVNEKLTERVLEYIDQEYTSNKLSLQAVAKYVQKSPAYISKIFKDVTGDNYVRYVSNKRLTKALDLLQNTSLLVYQITEAVGWSDQSSFIRLFKKQYGLTPSEILRVKSTIIGQTSET